MKIELRVNDAPLIIMQTEKAVAADYVSFMQGVSSALLNDKNALENEAQKSGKTIDHPNFNTLGSIAIKDPTNL